VSYCSRVHYLKVSTEGAVRVDLAGEPAGNVTAKEAGFAQRRLIAKKAAAGKPTSKAFSNAELLAKGSIRRYWGSP